MEYYSTSAHADKMSKVRGEILDVKRGMVENIDKVLDRGDKIELLVDKTSSLQVQYLTQINILAPSSHNSWS